MKNLICFCSILFLNMFCFAQHGLEANYNKVYIGRNFSLNYRYEMDKISFHAGVSFHANRLPVPIGSFIKNGAHASEPYQHFGLLLKLDHKIFENNFAEFGVYYSNQLNFIDHKIRLYPAVDQLVPDPQSELDYVYSYHVNDFGPVFSSDNIFGLYLRVKLSKKFYISISSGAGFVFWKSVDNNVFSMWNRPSHGFDFSSQFSMGMGYKFGKK